MAPPLHTLQEDSKSRIRNAIDKATSDPSTTIPGFICVAINSRGEEIFSHASGLVGGESPDKMSLDSVFWIASCTKMVGGMACLHAVEKGPLSLDDGDQVEKFCPELKDKKILQGFDKEGNPILVAKKTKITLRMLLSHTAGFGYTFFNPDLRKFGLPAGIDEFSGRIEDMNTPLLFEPGTQWQYGTNIDWACILLSRATGTSLSSYIQENIFKPLGIKEMSFWPSQEMKKRLVHMHQRAPDGKVTEREHLLRGSLYETSQAQQKGAFESAGAGLFAEPREYVKIIAVLLNEGKCPRTGAKILSPQTVQEMFKNQIPSMPDFGRQPIPAAIPTLTNPLPALYPQPEDQEQGWGLTFMLTIHEGPTGRGRNTGWWAGLPNLFWWADRERGVGGMVASQVVPFGDAQVMGLWAQCEAIIYQG